MNSERLSQLNTIPLHDDVAYAAIVGTHVELLNLGPISIVNLFSAVQPIQDPSVYTASKPYFPWIYEFHKGVDDTDGIVPVWSARLGTVNVSVEVNHISMGKDPTINNTVRAWLNGANPQTGTVHPVPLGSAQRAAFLANEAPHSVQNAYVKSTVDSGSGRSIEAGLNRNAIIKVELDPDDQMPFYGVGNAQNPNTFQSFGTGPNEVGARPNALTGMIRQEQIGVVNFKLVVESSLFGSDTLHNLGVLGLNQLNITGVQTQAGDHAPYRIASGKIGRRHEPIVTGPDGSVGGSPTRAVGYESAAIPQGGRAPHTFLRLPGFILPAPVKGGPGNLTLTLTGAAETRHAAQAQQTNKVRVYDDDEGAPDDLLDKLNVAVPHPAGVWNGLLIPYSATSQLFINNKGHVAGPKGTSKENPAQVYQKLIEPGLVPNTASAPVTVP